MSVCQLPTHKFPCTLNATNLANSSVAVFGCGCIGLGVLNAARIVGASRIIAIDTNPNKAKVVKEFGGDKVEFINPKDLPEGKTITQHLIDITDGGLDYTFDATGNVRVDPGCEWNRETN